jgi:O-antigen/teichoic acid export membrane protein
LIVDDLTMESNVLNDHVEGLPAQERRRFSVNVAITIAARVLMLASALGTSIVVAHWFGTAGVGLLAAISVLLALSVQLGSLGLPSANTFFIAQDRSTFPRVWSNALSFGLVIGFLISAVLILTARSHASWFGNVPASLITIAAFGIPAQLITLLGLNVLLGIERIDRFNLLDAIGQFLLLLNALLVVALSTGLLGLVSFNTAAALLMSVIVVVVIFRTKRTTPGKIFDVDFDLFKRMLRYGLKFHVANLSWIVILRADLLIVNHFRSTEEAGVYAVATQMSSLLLLLPGIIGTLLFPRVAAEPDSRGSFTMRITRHTAFVMLLICVVAATVSFALPFVYGSAFKDSTIQLLILIPGIYLMGIESVMVQHFTGQGLPIAIPIFWVVALIANISLNLAVIPIFGARGAACVSTFTYSLMFALVAVYFRHKTKNTLSTALLLRRSELGELLSAARVSLFRR